MITTKKKSISRKWASDIDKMKHTALAIAGGEDATVDSVLDTIFGTAYGEYEDQLLEVYTFESPKVDSRSILQRFNTLWVIPLYFACVPFAWLFKGRTSIDSRSKLGRIIIKLIGED